MKKKAKGNKAHNIRIEAEFEQFKAFYKTFKKLTEQPEKIADFEHEKQKLLCNVEKLWPRIEELCKQFDISLERVKMEEAREQAARRFAWGMSGKTDSPEPKFQLPGKELITLAIVKNEIDSCSNPGDSGESGLFPKNLATQFIGKIKLPMYIQRRNTIKKILAAVLAHLSEHFSEEIETKSSPEQPAETKQNRKTTIVAIIISFIVDLVFELLVYFVPFSWVKNHPNSYGLQGSIIFLIPCLIVGLFKPQSRKWCWGVAGLAFLLLIVSLLGGSPADSNVN